MAIVGACSAVAPPVATAATDPEATVLVHMAARTDAAAEKAALARAGVTAVGRLGPQGVVVAAAKSRAGAKASFNALRADPTVAWAEPNARVTTSVRPDDPRFPGNGVTPALWGLDNDGTGGLLDADIDAPEAWERLPEGLTEGAPWPADGTTVGVVDTGVYAAHEDLAGKIVSPCFEALSGNGSLQSGCADADGHGTHVTGTIAAQTNNATGIGGVAPNARVLMCRALGADGSGYIADVAACVNHLVGRRAELGLRVISMSLGGGYSSTLRSAVDNAAAAGILVVAAAGNDGTSQVHYPAGHASVVSVAATDRYDAHASFSNVNDDVELSAPGVSIVSTVPVFGSGGHVSSGYSSFSGTSMATPHVAAAAALVAGVRSLATVQELRAALQVAVDDLGVAGRDPQFGFGRINLCTAVAGQSCDTSVEQPVANVPPTARIGGLATPVVAGTAVTIDGSGSADPDGLIVQHAWDLDGNDTIDAYGPTVTTTFPAGIHSIALVVTDDRGATDRATLQLAAEALSETPALSPSVADEVVAVPFLEPVPIEEPANGEPAPLPAPGTDPGAVERAPAFAITVPARQRRVTVVRRGVSVTCRGPVGTVCRARLVIRNRRGAAARSLSQPWRALANGARRHRLRLSAASRRAIVPRTSRITVEIRASYGKVVTVRRQAVRLVASR